MSLRGRALTIAAFAVAMAYIESACVVYLERALSITPDTLFPLRSPEAVGDLAAVEVGREVATLVLLGAAGWLAGRNWQTRLAWAAVAFGIWDIAYYFWLWVFLGWPASLAAWDLLFLIPVPWAGPVWAPLAVSLALVGFGAAVARADGRGATPRAGWPEAALGLGGGLLVILSFTLDAAHLMDGGLPGWYPWPLLVAGLALGGWGAARAMRTGARQAAG
jgi:hypothetical protein